MKYVSNFSTLPGIADAREGFKTVLRIRTKAAHNRADAIFSVFQGDPRKHMHRFLSAQCSALEHLSPLLHRSENHEIRSAAMRMAYALDKDRVTRALRPAHLTVEKCTSPLAAAYVVFGSRLGLEILRRKEPGESTTDWPFFLERMNTAGAWRATCVALDRIDPYGPEADYMVAEVNKAFAIFFEAVEANA